MRLRAAARARAARISISAHPAASSSRARARRSDLGGVAHDLGRARRRRRAARGGDGRRRRAATITTQAAEKIYRSLGADAASMSSSRSSRVPSSNICRKRPSCSRARLAAPSTLAVAPAGVTRGRDVVFGRAARGERLTRACFMMLAHTPRRPAALGRCAAPRGRYRPRGCDRAFGFAGAEALATALYVGDDAERHLPLARKLARSGACRGSASLVQRRAHCAVSRFARARRSPRAGPLPFLPACRRGMAARACRATGAFERSRGACSPRAKRTSS